MLRTSGHINFSPRQNSASDQVALQMGYGTNNEGGQPSPAKPLTNSTGTVLRGPETQSESTKAKQQAGEPPAPWSARMRFWDFLKNSKASIALTCSVE
jgi:hypothetical protein